MKIGIYLPPYSSPSTGGAFGYYSQLLQELLSRKTAHELCLLVRENNNVFLLECQKRNPSIPFINVTYKSDSLVQGLRFSRKISGFVFEKRREAHYNKLISDRILEKLKADNIQFIYCLSVGEYVTPDIPYLANVWDMGHRNVNFFPEVSALGEYEKREKDYNKILPRAAIISAESQAGKKDIEFYFRIKPEKIIVMPMFPGNVIHEQVPATEQDRWLKEKNIAANTFLFYPAQFWAHKNHVNLLKALVILKDQYKKILPLVLTGSDKGNLAFIKKKISELDLSSQVNYLGFVSEKELRILYENAYALIMPTFLGPTTMPILEAAALGCPVICSDIEGHREQMEEAALYFKPESPDDIAEKILSLLNNSNLRNELIAKEKVLFESGKNSVKDAVDILLKTFDDFEAKRNCWE